MSKSEKSLSPKKKQTLIAIVGFVSGLLSGLLGAPYAGLISGASKIAVEAIEAVPEKDTDAHTESPAPVMAPVAPVAPAEVPAPAPEAAAVPAPVMPESAPAAAPVQDKK